MSRELQGDVPNQLFELFILFPESVVFQETHGAFGFGTKPVIDGFVTDAVLLGNIAHAQFIML